MSRPLSRKLKASTVTTDNKLVKQTRTSRVHRFTRNVVNLKGSSQTQGDGYLVVTGGTCSPAGLAQCRNVEEQTLRPGVLGLPLCGCVLQVVTSGRLTGGAKVNLARKHVDGVAPNPAPIARPEPAYSLYSTDSEDQVTTLHKGLDRCAALLDGILQVEKAATPTFPRAGTGAVAKSRPSPSLGKKSLKKLPTTVQKSSQLGRCAPGTTTPKSRRLHVPAAHSGVKLHPPRKQPLRQLQSHHVTPPHPSQPSVLLSVVQSSSRSDPLLVHRHDAATETLSNECDLVPVKDVNSQSTDAQTSPRLQICTTRKSGNEVAQKRDAGKDCSTEEVKMVQYLLEELKALIAGQGSVAEMLLGYLEQAVSSPHVNNQSLVSHTGTDLSSAQTQNTQLCRSVRTLEQHLKQQTQPQQKTGALSNSEASTLQGELTTAQSRLQELQDNLSELRKALQDAQRQLLDTEEEKRALRTELETTRSKLVESEQEKSKLSALAQQRLLEIENLKILHTQESWECATVVGSVSDAQLLTQQHEEGPARPPPEHITQYLNSLEQLPPNELVCATAERDGNMEAARRRLLDSTLSHLDVESVRSDWSMRSESTFNTRDEAAFRDGLAALDASIASLQKTIQLDLRR